MCNTIVMINICMCNYMILRSRLFQIDNATQSNERKNVPCGQLHRKYYT
jgi:hypothetical protein